MAALLFAFRAGHPYLLRQSPAPTTPRLSTAGAVEHAEAIDEGTLGSLNPGFPMGVSG